MLEEQINNLKHNFANMLALQWRGEPSMDKPTPQEVPPLQEQQPLEEVKRGHKIKHSAHHGKRAPSHHREKHGDRHRSSKRAESRAPQPTGSGQAGLAAVGAVAAYCTLRGGVKLFHHARRGMLRQLLFDVCPLLSSYKYWLDFGSLLGIHRDGDLILHDNDVDIAVLNPDWDQLQHHLSASLPQYSVRLEYPSDAVGDTVFLRVYCMLGFADIFGAAEIEEGRLLVDCGHGDTTSIAKDLIVPTGSMEWKGVEINVPRDLEGALLARYGPTWRIPRYMDKGADVVEGQKTYARIFRGLAKLTGIRL